MWGTTPDCGGKIRVKVIGNQIQNVKNKAGEPSKLYSDILEYIKGLSREVKEALKNKYRAWEGTQIRTVDQDKDLGLAIYAHTTSENFTKLKLPQEKGEYKFEDVKDNLLVPKSDKFQQKQELVGSTASPETIAMYKEAAKRMGFDLHELTEGLVDEHGNKITANGSVDLIGKVIQVAQGNIPGTLGEEVSHAAVRIIKKNDPSLFKEMMNQIGSYSIFKDVVDLYKNDKNYQLEDGKPNIPKLKEEAIGKIFNEYVINLNEGSTEKPELRIKAGTWWEKVKESIKNLLNKLGFDFSRDAIEKGAKEFLDDKNKDKDFHQLNSDELKEQDEQLEKHLMDFLKPFNVKVQVLDSLKEKFGLDSLGVADVLNKMIYLKKERKLDTMPEEFSHMIVMLMGENHPEINQLLKNIENWSEFKKINDKYSPIYKNDKQVKLEAIGQLIGKSLVKNYQAYGTDKNFIQKALDIIKQFFDKLLSTGHPLTNEHLADKIALNVLHGNKDYVATLKGSKNILDYETAIKNNPLANYLLNKIKGAGVGAKLTGSLAIAHQGEKIDRPNSEEIHDLDFVVDNEAENLPKIYRFIKSIGGVPIHTGWGAKGKKDYICYSFQVPKEGYHIEAIRRGPTGWLEYYHIKDNKTGERIGAWARNSMSVDFFVYSKESNTKSVGDAISWQDIYKGKSSLGKDGDYERTFSRDKDQTDYINSDPDNRDYIKPEFLYHQLDPNKEKVDNLFSKVNGNPGVEKKDDGDGESHYEDFNGKKVNRVTELVHTFLEKLFKNKSQLGNLDEALQRYKKEFGTANHADIAHIHERHINPITGELRDTPELLQNGFVPQSGDLTYYQTLENYIYGYIDENNLKHTGLLTNETNFPKGTKFSWEKTLFDPTNKINGVYGLAGTVDLMAIKPDGKVSIFDWKFIGSLTKNEGIRDYMKRAYDKQMFGYTSILTSPTYGVKSEDIEMARMIPISVKYSEEAGHEGEVSSLVMGDPNYKAETIPYLLPYVTTSEKSGDSKLQGLVNALLSNLNTVSAKGTSEKDFVVRKNKIQNLERAILHLQLSKDFTPFIEQVKNFLNTTVEDLKKIGLDLKAFNPKEIKNLNELDDKLQPLVEIVNNLKLYKEIGKFVNYIDDSTTEGKQQKQQLVDLEKNADYLYQPSNKVHSGALDFLNLYVKQWADSRSIWDILNPQTLLSEGAKWLGIEFRTPSKSPSIAIQAAYDLNNIRLNKVEHESNSMISEIKPIWEKITKEWGGVKKLSDIVEKKDKNGKGTNKFIDEFSIETTDKLKSLVEEKNHIAVREMIDSKKFDEWAIPYRKEQLSQIEKATWLPYLGKQAEERKQEEKDKVISETTFTSDLAVSNFYRMKGFLKNSLRSEEYKNLLKDENKPAFDFYNFSMKWNKEAVTAGIFHDAHQSTFMPWIEKSLADKVAYGGRWNVWDQFRKGFTSVKHETGVEQVDPLTNEVISHIPKYFVREISRTSSIGEQDFSNVSDDLIKNVSLFAQSVIDYKSKVETQNTFDALKLVEEAKGMLQTDSRGNIVGHTDDNKNLQYYVDYLKVHFYDKSILSGLDLKFGKVDVDNEEREYNATKALEGLKSYFSYNVLGLNTVTSVFRSITTATTGWYNAGKYYTTSQFMKSYGDFVNFRTFKQDTKLTVQLLKLFYPVEENLHEEIDQLAGSKVAEADFQSFLMKMVKSAHNIVQYTNFLAHMDNTIVNNGKLVNAREYLNRNSNKYKLTEEERTDFEKNLDSKVKELVKEKGIINLAKIDEKGKLSIDGLDLNDFSIADLKSTISTQGRILSGNISEVDQSHIRTNAWVRQMFLFTNWLPQSIDQRVGGLAYNRGTQSYEYGRMRMAAKLMFTDVAGFKGAIPRLKSMIDIYKANDKGVQALNTMYENYKSDYLRKTGLELHMTSDEWNDMVRQNLKIQGKELLAVLSFIGLSMGLAAVLPKKDDSDWEGSQGYFAYMKRVVNRAEDELLLFYNPLKFAEFGSGAKLPVLGVLNDLKNACENIAHYGYGLATGDENIDKIHVLPKVLNTLPSGIGIKTVGETIFPEWFKEEGAVLNPEPQGAAVK